MNRLALLAKAVLAAVLVGWLLRSGRLDLATLGAATSRGTILVLVALQLLSLAPPIVRWFLLLRAEGLPVRLAPITQVSAIGVFANTVLPAGVGIDGTRLAYLGPVYGRTADITATLIVDRVLGLVALVGLAAALALGAAAPHSSTVGPLLAWAGGGVAAGCLVLWVFTRLARGGARGPGWLRALSASLGRYRHRLPLISGLLGLSLVGHALTLATFAMASRGYVPEAPLGAVLAASGPVMVAGVLPLTPLGLGVTDTVADVLYRNVGLAHGAETVMLLRLVGIVVSLACGLAWLRPVRWGTR